MTGPSNEPKIDEIVRILKDYLKNDVPVITRLSRERRDPFIVLVGTLLSLRTKDETTEKAVESTLSRVRRKLKDAVLTDLKNEQTE